MTDVETPPGEPEARPPSDAQVRFVKAISQYTDPLDGLEYYKDELFEGIDPEAADITSETDPDTGALVYTINESTSGVQIVRFLKNYAALIEAHADEWVFGTDA